MGLAKGAKASQLLNSYENKSLSITPRDRKWIFYELSRHKGLLKIAPKGKWWRILLQQFLSIIPSKVIGNGFAIVSSIRECYSAAMQWLTFPVVGVTRPEKEQWLYRRLNSHLVHYSGIYYWFSHVPGKSWNKVVLWEGSFKSSSDH